MKTFLNEIHMDRLLKALGFKSDRELARYLDISAQAVSAARKKNKVPPDWFLNAAMRENLSLDSVLFNEHGKFIEVKIPEPITPIPIVEAQLSAGCGSLETCADVLGFIDFKSSWLTGLGNPSKMVLMRVSGNSMEPYIHDKDLALICQDQTRILPHKVYAVGIDDEIYIKQIETLPGHQLVLRSYNEKYAPITIDMRGDLADSVRIIGRAVWWCHES